MRLRLVLAISALVAMPAFAQPQQGGAPPNAGKPTIAQVQKVVQIISGNKVKTQQYCDIEKLEQQIAEAEQKQDTKRLEELIKQADDLGEKIGPEYVAMMDGLSQIDEVSNEGKQIDVALASLDGCDSTIQRTARRFSGSRWAPLYAETQATRRAPEALA